MDDSPYITIAQASAWAGISPATVLNAGKAGNFDIFSVGGRKSPQSYRVEERSFGKRYGLPLPGPREIELEMEQAERMAAKADRRTPRTRSNAAHWLYWFYDRNERLLYIGITNQGVKRMEQHGADKIWWPQVASIKVDHFATRDACLAAEEAAIKEHRPAYNGTYNREYRQSPNVTPSFDEMIV